MNIAVLGTGNVGKALGCRWAERGHAVYFGARDPGSAEAQQVLARAGSNARLGTCAEAIAASDAILLGIPFDQTRGVLASAASLDGKIVMDCINPLTPDLQGLTVGHTTSAAEQIAELVSDRAGGEGLQHIQRGDDGEPALWGLRRACVHLRR